MLMGVKELMFYCIEQEAQVRSKRRVEGTRVMKGGGVVPALWLEISASDLCR